MHAKARPAHLRLGALAMHDPAAGSHPVDVARLDRLREAQTVAMENPAVEQIGDGGEANVRMRLDLHAAARRHVHRAKVVEKDERPDHATLHARQDTAHGKAATQVVGTALDQKFDRIGHLVLPLRLCCNGTP